MKTKLKSYGDEATDFCNKEMPKAGFNYTILGVILLDFVSKKNENFYMQVFLKECKYIKNDDDSHKK